MARDATHGVRVKSHVEQPNQLAFPQFDDVEAMVNEFKEHAARALLMMAFDIKAAHRLVPIHPGTGACRPAGWMRRRRSCSTFGVASAAFWRGRVAGVAFHVFQRLLNPRAVFCLMLFADDGLELMEEMPLSWPKTRGGHAVEWIGYNVDIQSWRLGVSAKKVEWMRSWAQLAL